MKGRFADANYTPHSHALWISYRVCLQMTATDDQTLDMEFYLQKTYCKTASLMANSARSVALLAGSSPAVR